MFLKKGARDFAGFGERGAGHEDQAELGDGWHVVGGKIVADFLNGEEKTEEEIAQRMQRRGERESEEE